MNSQSKSPKAIPLFALPPGANDRQRMHLLWVDNTEDDLLLFCHNTKVTSCKQLLQLLVISDQLSHKSMAAAMDQAQGVVGIVQVMSLPDKGREESFEVVL